MESETCDTAGPDAGVRPTSHVISAGLGVVPVRSGKSRTLVAEQVSSSVGSEPGKCQRACDTRRDLTSLQFATTENLSAFQL